MFKRAKLKIGAFINHLYKKEFVSFEINILKMQKKKKKKKHTFFQCSRASPPTKV
jgi:hypothetical protein